MSMKNLIKVNKDQKIALAIATVMAGVVAVLFLEKYLILIVVATIVALLFNPVYLKLIAKGKTPSTAASITLLITFLSLIIPLTLLIAITTVEVASLIDTIEKNAKNYNICEIGQQMIDFINNIFRKIGLSF